MTKTFLHVGCGSKSKAATTRGFNTPEWNECRLDIDPGVRPDVVASITDMAPVAAASFDAIYSSHNLEHLYPHEVPGALAEFLRVLKPDGFCVVTCPDLQSVCARIAEGGLLDPVYVSPSGPVSPIDILYGFRPSIAKGHTYMAHRGGFTQASMVAALRGAGFQTVASMRRPHPKYDLFAVAARKTLSEAEIRSLAAQHFPR